MDGHGIRRRELESFERGAASGRHSMNGRWAAQYAWKASVVSGATRACG